MENETEETDFVTENNESGESDKIFHDFVTSKYNDIINSHFRYLPWLESEDANEPMPTAQELNQTFGI